MEINAYWYNALRMMAEWEKLGIGEASHGKGYAELAEKVRKSFGEKFWNEKENCLKDVLPDKAGDTAENQIRCNQIWAVSQPFSLLSKERERAVVEKVFEKLSHTSGTQDACPGACPASRRLWRKPAGTGFGISSGHSLGVSLRCLLQSLSEGKP